MPLLLFNNFHSSPGAKETNGNFRFSDESLFISFMSHPWVKKIPFCCNELYHLHNFPSKNYANKIKKYFEYQKRCFFSIKKLFKWENFLIVSKRKEIFCRNLFTLKLGGYRDSLKSKTFNKKLKIFLCGFDFDA